MNIKYVERYKTKADITNWYMFAAPHWNHIKNIYDIKQPFKKLSNAKYLSIKKPI